MRSVHAISMTALVLATLAALGCGQKPGADAKPPSEDPAAARERMRQEIRAEVESAVRDRMEREAQAKREQDARDKAATDAMAKADQEAKHVKAEKARQLGREQEKVAEAEDRALRNLWAGHRYNFVVANGKFFRVPDAIRNKEFPLLIVAGLGQVGSIYELKVLQVLNDNAMLAECRMGNLNGYGDKIAMIIGPTSGFTDGDTSPGYPVAFVGTTSYTTVTGASRTVPLAVTPAYAKQQGVTLNQFREIVKAGVDLGPDRQAEVEQQAKAQHEAAGQQAAAEKADVEARASAILARAERGAKEVDVARAANHYLEAEALLAETKRRAQNLVKSYPQTRAAGEAKKLLADLERKSDPESKAKAGQEAAARRSAAQEQEAAAKLNLARRFLDDAKEARVKLREAEASGLLATATRRLREIVQDYPNTNAANQAKALLANAEGR